MGFIIFVYLGGLICLWTAQLPVWLKMPISFFALIGGLHSLQRYGLLTNKKSVVHLQSRLETWLLSFRDNTQVEMYLSINSFRSRFITILLFESDKLTIRVPVIRDAVSNDCYRRLLQYLMIKRSTA